MDLSASVTALGTSFGDVGTTLITVGIAAMTAVAGTGLVFAGLRFILARFGIGQTALNSEGKFVSVSRKAYKEWVDEYGTNRAIGGGKITYRNWKKNRSKYSNVGNDDEMF